MSTEPTPVNVGRSGTTGRAVFLSYAREDSEVARRIADALRAFGVEVWFDQNELRGGDAWDAKIKKQIRECTLFVPVISAATERRGEGYFRREWKQGIERLQDMSANRVFLLPVVVDGTPEGHADVPDEFLRVQWMRLANGVPTAEFVAQVQRALTAPQTIPVRGPGVRNPSSPSSPIVGNPALAATSASTDVLSVPPSSRRRPQLVIALATAAMAIVAVAITGTWYTLRKPSPLSLSPSHSPLTPSVPQSLPPSAKSIAVLPFANFSSDKDNAFFADGLHDEVITALAKIHDLKVISRTSVMLYRDVENRNLKKIAADLGVADILEGSVQRAGSKVHLNVQLIDARTDEHLWADSYTRDVTDIFSAEADLAVAVTTALKSTLSPQEKSLLDRRPTQNQEAYDLYLRARVLDEALASTSSRADYEQVLALYRRAAALDAAFLLPHVQAALVNGVMYWFTTLDATPGRLELARQEMEASERLAADAPETHLARGSFEYTCNLNWSGALAEYERAQFGLPNNAQLLYRIGLAERRLGHMHAALRQFQRAADLDPNATTTVITLVETTAELRRYADVLSLCDRYAISSSGGNEMADFKISARFELTGDRAAYLRDTAARPTSSDDPFGLQAAYAQAMRIGDFAAAERILADPRMVPILEPSGTFMMPVSVHRALVAWLRGDSNTARRFAADALAALKSDTGSPRQRYFGAMARALAEALAGQVGPAVRDAKAAVDAETAQDKYSGAMLLYEYGRVLVIAGRDAEALAVLREIIANASPPLNSEIRYEPVWSRLKRDPGFDQILDSATAL